MSPISISFGGTTIKRTGAYSTVDTSKMTVVNVGASKVLAFVGKANTTNTVPVGQVYYFNNPSEAIAKIGDSDLLECMKLAWAHGADVIAVSPVTPTAPVDADWQNAIDLLENELVHGIVLVNDAVAITAKVKTHVIAMSATNARRERRAFYGHATGLTATAVVALQSALAGERGVMATPSIYVLDSGGNKVLKASYYLASCYAGIWASQKAQDPITYKYVNIVGLEKNYKTSEIEALLTGGIAPTEYVLNKGYRIVQGATLDISTDLTKTELSVSTLKDEMNSGIREYFEEKYVGKAGEAGIEITIYNDLISILERYVKEGKISSYVKEAVQVIKNGTAFTLEWEGTPTLPINNFLMTSHLTL